MLVRQIASLVAVAGCFSAAVAGNTGSLTVTIHRNYLERLLNGGVRTYVDGSTFAKDIATGSVTGRVSCKRNSCTPESFVTPSPSSMRARYRFKVALNNLPDFDFSADLNVSFSCAVANPSLQVAITVGAIDVHSNWYKIIESLLSAEIGSIASDVVPALNADLNASALGLPFCPRFAPPVAGGVVMNFAAGSECGDGAQRTQSCTQGYVGPGTKYICQNGWWWRLSSECIKTVTCRSGQKCCESDPSGACTLCRPAGTPCP
jgi:hypothetical protein